MPLAQEHLQYIRTLVPAEAILEPSHPNFKTLTQTWVTQLQRSPSLVIQPQNLESLSSLVQYLYSNDDIDFAIRTGGVGSASAKDILIEMSAFNSFSFSIDHGDDTAASTSTSEATVTLGAGQLWEHVDKKMKTQVPRWAVVGARSPYVGVSGFLLMGGLSWYSHEYGMGSDPQNLLDAEVVLPDGRVVWARDGAPDVLWAMRGGRTAFGVITRVKLRARRLTTTGILAGNIIFPTSALAIISRRVSEFVHTNDDGKMALYCFLLNSQSPFSSGMDGVGLIIYDAHGEEHGRSEKGFKWAFDIPGGQDMTNVMDFGQLNELTNVGLGYRGRTQSYFAGGLIPDFDPDFIVRCATWQSKVLATDPALAAGSFVIVEAMGKAAFGSLSSPSETAFPHTAARHVLQLGCGWLAESGTPRDGDEVALRLLKEAFEEIPLEKDVDMGQFSPVSIAPFMDMQRMYGSNLDRLKSIAAKYDPRNKFNPGLW